MLRRFRDLDWLGFVLFGAGYVAFVLFGSLGGSVWTWHSGRTLACIVISAVCLTAFAVQQAFSILVCAPENRLFPVHMLGNWEQWIFFVQTAGCLGSVLTVVYFLPVFFQWVRTDSALAAGLKLLPAICTMVSTRQLSK